MCVINVRSLILSDIHIFPITGAWKSRTLFTARFLSHSTKPSPPGAPPSPRRYYRATCFSGVLDDWRCIKKAYIEIVAGWVTCGYFPFVAKNSNHQTLWYIGWSLGGKSTTPRPDSRGIQGLKRQETNEHRADRGVNKHTLKGRYLASVHTKALSPRQCFLTHTNKAGPNGSEIITFRTNVWGSFRKRYTPISQRLINISGELTHTLFAHQTAVLYVHNVLVGEYVFIGRSLCFVIVSIWY